MEIGAIELLGGTVALLRAVALVANVGKPASERAPVVPCNCPDASLTDTDETMIDVLTETE